MGEAFLDEGDFACGGVAGEAAEDWETGGERGEVDVRGYAVGV